MQLTRYLEDDRTYRKIVMGLAGLALLAVIGFGVYYYLDRYSSTSISVVDREIARAEQMVRNDPSNPATRVALGTLYMRKGALTEAAGQFNEALKADDSNQEALAGLGLTLYRSGKMNESAAAFERLVELTKDNIPLQRAPVMGAVHYYLGRIYASQGNLTRAEEELKLTLGIQRTDADAMVALADVVSQQSRYEEAIQAYRFALRLVPNYSEAYQGLSKAYEATGMATEASYASAMVAYCAGEYDTALSRLQQVVQSKPDLADAYYGLGATYEKKNDRERAVEAYLKALELDPAHESARVSLQGLGVEPPAGAVPAAGH